MMERKEAMEFWFASERGAEAYGKLVSEAGMLMEPDEAERCYDLVPGHLWGGFARWVLFGVVPGHFLQAVIKNDLFGAMGRADDGSKAGLPQLCMAFYNYTPAGCFKSSDALKDWGGLFPEKVDA
jgi:hypothetical protein